MPDVCKPEKMLAEDPSFILYTSGSTGKPKVIMHTTGGYLLGATMSFKYIFGFSPEDVIGVQLMLVGLQATPILYMGLFKWCYNINV